MRFSSVSLVELDNNTISDKDKKELYEYWHNYYYNKILGPYENAYQVSLANYKTYNAFYLEIKNSYTNGGSHSYEDVISAYQDATTAYQNLLSAKAEYNSALDNYNNQINSLVQAAVESEQVIVNQETTPVPGQGSSVFNSLSPSDPKPGLAGVTQSFNTNSTINTAPYRRSRFDFGFTISNGDKWSIDIRSYPYVQRWGKIQPPSILNNSYKGLYTDNFTENEWEVFREALYVNRDNWGTDGVLAEGKGEYDIKMGASGPRLDILSKYDPWIAGAWRASNGKTYYTRANNGDLLSMGGLMKAGSTSTDYLVMGYWLQSPNDVINLNDIVEVGMFATGGDPFRQNNLRGISGNATYSGPIIAYLWPNNVRVGDNLDTQTYGGLSLSDASGCDYGFPNRCADINLNVNFDGNNLGVISGTIDNLRGRDRTRVNGSLNLREANIGESHSGFFNSTIIGTLNGNDYKGKWGGQFYGNDRADGFPESVAGTASATSSDGELTIMAPWIADKSCLWLAVC